MAGGGGQVAAAQNVRPDISRNVLGMLEMIRTILGARGVEDEAEAGSHLDRAGSCLFDGMHAKKTSGQVMRRHGGNGGCGPRG